jgi:hypothetical protein
LFLRLIPTESSTPPPPPNFIFGELKFTIFFQVNIGSDFEGGPGKELEINSTIWVNFWRLEQEE